MSLRFANHIQGGTMKRFNGWVLAGVLLMSVAALPRPGLALTASSYSIKLGYGEVTQIQLSGGAGSYSIVSNTLFNGVYEVTLAGNLLTVRNKLGVPGDGGPFLWGTSHSFNTDDPYLSFNNSTGTYDWYSPPYSGTTPEAIYLGGRQSAGGVRIPAPPGGHPYHVYRTYYRTWYWDTSVSPSVLKQRYPSLGGSGPYFDAYKPDGVIVVSDGANLLPIGVGPSAVPDDSSQGGPHCDSGLMGPTHVGKPVNVTTGNMFYAAPSDGTVRGRGLTLDLARAYNSQGKASGLFGAGWSFPLGMRWEWMYTSSSKSLLKVVDAEGKGHRFFRSSTGVFSRAGNAEGELSGSPTTELIWTDGQTSYHFDSRCNLTSIQDAGGEAATLSYDPATRMLAATLDNGRGFAFAFTEKRFFDGTDTVISQATVISHAYLLDGNGSPLSAPLRSYHYASTSDGRWVLSQVRDGNGEVVEEYLYDGPADFPTALTEVRRHGASSVYTVETHAYGATNGKALSSGSGGDLEVLSLDYSVPGQTMVTDLGGNQTVYTVLGPNRVSAVEGEVCTSCGGAAAAYSYNGYGNITGLVDREGNRTERGFDARGNLAWKTVAVGSAQQRTTSFEYHPDLDLVTRETAPSALSAGSRTVRYEYRDGSGLWTPNLQSVVTSGYTLDQNDAVVPLSRTTSYTNNTFGQVAEVDGPRPPSEVSDVTTLEYNPNTGDLTKVTDPVDNETLFSGYDLRGNPTVITDANDVATVFSYDGEGRVGKVTRAGQTTYYRYLFRTGSDLLASITPPGGNTLTFGYDAAQRLTSVTDALNNRIEYGYDLAGNRSIESIIDKNLVTRQTVSYVYNALRQLEELVQPGSQITHYDYDDNGNRTGVTTPDNRFTSFSFDPLDRLVASARSLGAFAESTNFVYDPADNLVRVQDANRNATEYTYDDAGQLLKAASPDSGTTRYFYDPAGNLIRKVDGRGVEALYTYDAANRLLSVSYPSDASLNVTYAYDLPGVANAKGRLGRVTDSTGSTEYRYDSAGRVLSETRVVLGVSLNTAYSWNLDGSLATQTFPSGRTVTFTRGVTGALTRVTAHKDGTTDTLLSSATPHPFGGYDALTYGNGVATTFDYDQSGRLASLTAGGFLSYTYSRLGGGDITGINDQLNPPWSSFFEYDDVGRLKYGLGCWGVEEYSYDFAGNRLEKKLDGVLTEYHLVQGSNKLESASGEESGLFVHDEMGSLTKSGEYDFQYDATGRMKKAFRLNTLVGEYRYNAAGQRISKNGQRLYLYGLGGELIGEYQTDGTPVSEMVYADGLRLAEYRDIKTPPPPLPRGPEGYNLSRDSGFATEERTYIKATDTLWTRVWAADVDPTLATVKEGKLFIGSTAYTYPLSYDPAAAEWRGSLSLAGVDLSKGNFWSWKATLTDSGGHSYQPASTVTVSTGAFIKIQGPQINNITAVTPNNFDTTGNVRVSIEGRDFSWSGGGIYSVYFGDLMATALSVSGTRIKATVPARFFPGKVDVRIRKVGEDGVVSEGVFPASFTFRWPTSGANLLYYHSDHLGTPLFLTNSKGTVVWHGEQRPFGGLFLEETDPDGNGIHLTQPFRFPGQVFDAETGLHYNYFRDYDPKLGRYIEADPIGQGGGRNIFGYARNNPEKFFDISGEKIVVRGRLAAGPLGTLTQPDSYHLYLFIDPDDKCSCPGKWPVTLGATSNLGSLVKVINSPSDLSPIGGFSVPVSTPSGMTECQFAHELIAAALAFEDTGDYSLPGLGAFLGLWDGGLGNNKFNSNSFIPGLLIAVGAKPPDLPCGAITVPGYENPVTIPKYTPHVIDWR